ncbi:MAG TPA: hypothetical protein VLW85_22590 [Myxococcales bacterium]|nr:hypothetical protein [Myxococcales bacterium]
MIAALLIAAAVDAQNPLRVDEVRSVQLDAAARLFRDGKPQAARDGLLLRLTVFDPSPFSGPGRVLLGHGVCETLVAAAQELSVFCARPAAGEPQLVWQIDALADPSRLPADRTQRMMDRAASVDVAAALPKAVDGGKFKDLQTVRKSLQK